ncbi:MAG: hypothetical protein ACRCX2_00870 [Paraclostridium sp.]
MDKTQFIYTTRENYLDNIVNIKQASEMLNITDGYLRQLVLKGEFETWEYKKFDRAIIFIKESIESRADKFKK